jgi:hypothetical protein
MMAESWSSGTKMRQLLLCNGMVNMFPWQRMNMQQQRDLGTNVFYVLRNEPIAKPNRINNQ